MPACAREEAEAVARGRRWADAPARSRCARFQKLRRPQQEERQACIRGGELQPLAQFQIELVNNTGDGGRGARTQRLLQCPQGISPVRRFDQDQAAWIETQRTQAMPIKPAILTEPIARHDEKERTSPRHTGQQRDHEAEGGGGAAVIGHDLVQGAAGEAAVRQMAINRGKPEGEGFGGCKPLYLRQ